jgi:DNA repair exonuclease SbcCD ATPase subunit
MARKSTAFIRDEEDNVLRFEPAHEFLDSSDDSLDDVEHKVKAAQERLTHLRQQQEEIEREKKHLEELRQKQERFGSGKRDILEKLTRSASSLDRELYDAQKLVEEISITRDTFSRHLEILRSLQPEKWSRSQVDEELENALAAIEDAEEDYTKGIRRITTCRRSETASAPETEGHGHDRAHDESTHPQSLPFAGDDWNAWLRRGLAFTLPLIGTLIFALILIRLMF